MNQDALWDRLIAAARARGLRMLAHNLEGFRVEGTVFVRLGGGRLALRPVIVERPGMDIGWQSDADYRYFADKYLRPHHEAMVEMIGMLQDLAEKGAVE